MIRIAVSLVALLSMFGSAVAQTPPAPTTPSAQAAAPAKPAPKKAAPKAKPVAKQPAAVESGPCRLGVISVIGERYSVQKFGLTIFENEASEVPIDWGLDDLVFARVRAATSNDPAVRRIAYPKGVFEPFYNPKTILIRDPGERLPVIVRSFTANANCQRYLVATTFKAELPNTHMMLNGIGTFNQGIGGILRHSHLFANIAITLIDGRSYEEIKRPFANFGANFAAGLRLTEDPLNKLDNSLFPDPPAAAAANTALRERTRALLADRLDRGLPGYLKED